MKKNEKILNKKEALDGIRQECRDCPEKWDCAFASKGLTIIQPTNANALVLTNFLMLFSLVIIFSATKIHIFYSKSRYSLAKKYKTVSAL